MSGGWSRSKGRAGAFFIMPDEGSSWTQEMKDKQDPALRKAVRLTYKYFWRTYRRLEKQQKERQA